MGDVVQVFLESVETPEGDMLVSGQQAAQERRFHALWKELQERMEQRKVVKGELGTVCFTCCPPPPPLHPMVGHVRGVLGEGY